MAVGIRGPVAAATEMQHHEAVAGGIPGQIALQQRDHVFGIALAAIAHSLTLVSPTASQLSYSV